MKRMLKLGVVGAILGTSILAANAQTTNVVLGVNISLNGVVQNGDTVTKVKIGTKEVIQAIQPGASSKAKLLLMFPADGGDPTFLIRDEGTDNFIDSDTLRIDQIGDSVGTTTTSNAGVETQKETAIREFILETDTIDFDVQGYTTSTSSNKGRSGDELFELTFPTNASAKVSGIGNDDAENPAVLQGTISISGRKIEEVL